MGKVDIKDFLPGDIILFKVDDSEWISKAISILTNSDVSHAALYMGNSIISDEGLTGLACHNISEDNESRPIYVRRLKTPEDKNPVLKAAKDYINCNESYDKPALVLLGLILLYKKFPIHLIPVNLVIGVLKMIASEIDKYIAQHEYPNKHPMVCSQYVFQCYEDAGTAYNLSINGIIEKQQVLAGMANQVIKENLAEYIIKENDMAFFKTYDENVGSEFVKALENLDLSKPIPPVPDSFIKNKDLIKSVLYSSDKLHILLNKQNNNSDDTSNSIEKLINGTKALFVTPADLKDCTNLIDAGEDAIYRDPQAVTEI